MATAKTDWDRRRRMATTNGNGEDGLRQKMADGDGEWRMATVNGDGEDGLR